MYKSRQTGSGDIVGTTAWGSRLQPLPVRRRHEGARSLGCRRRRFRSPSDVADFTAIRRNLATRGKTTHIRISTADELDGVGMLPCLMVLDYEGQVTARPDAVQEPTDVTVHGLPADPKDKKTSVNIALFDTIIEELRVAFRLGFKCGAPTVVSDSWLDSWSQTGDVQLNSDPNETYLGCELTWIVKLDEKTIVRSA
jgi:hypothetical protein